MKKYAIVVIISLLMLNLVGCSKSKTENKVFQIGFTTAPVEDDPYFIFAKNFSNEVYKKTNGKIVIDIKGSGQLGQEGEMFTGMQIGTTDMAIMTNAYISGYIKEAGLFDLPFIFGNSKEAASILDENIGRKVLNEYEKYGIKALAYGEGGFRHLVTANAEVRYPGDFKGLKIRCMETDTYIKTYQQLETNAVPMSWSETITGLQQGTIDGLDIPISVTYTNGFVDIAKDLNLTGHFYSPLILCISKNIYDELNEEEKEILRQAAEYAGKITRTSNADKETKMLKEMENQGMKIIRDIDKDAFKKKFKDFYKSRSQVIGEEYFDELSSELNL